MAKKPKMSDKLKEGVSVQEIENFARKYTSEVFLVLALIIASISSIFDFFTSPGWTIFFTGLAVVVSIILPDHIRGFLAKIHQFVAKQQQSAQIAIGIVRIVIAIFIPFILFAIVGLHAGVGYYDLEKKSQFKKKSTKKAQETENKGPEA